MKHRDPGFTLIELLVVIAIIAALAALTAASLQKPRKRANMANAMADIQMLALGLEAYESDQGVLPGGDGVHPRG